MIDKILAGLKLIWDFIKKYWVDIIRFFINIYKWFKNKKRLEKLKEDKNKVAISIKEKLDNGDYEVYNVLWDKNQNEIDDVEMVSSGKLDNETKNKFKNKDMIVLQ